MKRKVIKPFRFKQFEIHHDQCAMKVGTDGVLLGAWADIVNNKYILDIGTGSGLIAIMIAQRNPVAEITGIEIDEKAALQAKENAENSPWKNRLEIEHSSLQDFIKIPNKKNSFNHIITNPPFFEIGTYNSSKERNQARQQSRLTFHDIIIATKTLLNPKGKLSIILPVNEGESFINLALKNELFLNRKLNVKAKKEKKVERLLLEFSFEKKEWKKKELIIQFEKRNDWTPEYIELTGAFYLKM